MTLNAILEWDAVAGATSYHVRCEDSVGAPIGTANPGDSDAQGVAGTGGALSYPVEKYLTGQPVGIYKFFVRAVNPVTGLQSAWTQINFDFSGLAAPTNLRFVEA